MVIGGVYKSIQKNPAQLLSPLAGQPTKQPKPLEKYTFTQLSNTLPASSKIRIESTQDKEAFTQHVASFTTDGKRMTMQINIPQQKPRQPSGYPIILMIRGFVDASIYQTGMGTKNAAAQFAQNGYMTIAPDFLGFGGSDDPNPDTIGARLEKPRDILNLIASIPSLDQVDENKISIWAHSNGGQIAISVLEISQKSYPTSLWAPVSKPFPYSILYYTDEYEDEGKALRQVIAQFEETYNVFDFSITSYIQNISAPMQIHQGGKDDAIPMEWSDKLVDSLKATNKNEIAYYRYPNADHNLQPDWNTAISRDIAFFEKYR